MIYKPELLETIYITTNHWCFSLYGIKPKDVVRKKAYIDSKIFKKELSYKQLSYILKLPYFIQTKIF